MFSKGWVRAIRGHSADTKELKFKDGDNLAFANKENYRQNFIPRQQWEILYYLADKLPRGRGHDLYD